MCRQEGGGVVCHLAVDTTRGDRGRPKTTRDGGDALTVFVLSGVPEEKKITYAMLAPPQSPPPKKTGVSASRGIFVRVLEDS